MTREYIEFLKRFLLDKKFRSKHLEFRRLSMIPRYSQATTTLLGKPIDIVDTQSFFGIYTEVFENETYKFKSDSETPLIIDGGSNIGLSVIYLKTLFPKARILSFEPDENLFSLLQRNLQSFGINDVEFHQSALWYENTNLSFMLDGSDSGRVVNIEGSKNITTVKAVRLKDFLTQRVDFLKLDIEGAELLVLEDCCDELKMVENLFVEYHSFVDQPQKIDRLFEILISAGFRVSADPMNSGNSPLYERKTYMGMDFQMNIYAYRQPKI